MKKWTTRDITAVADIMIEQRNPANTRHNTSDSIALGKYTAANGLNWPRWAVKNAIKHQINIKW